VASRSDLVIASPADGRRRSAGLSFAVLDLAARAYDGAARQGRLCAVLGMPRSLPKNSKISNGPGWPLDRRPQLAACIARIAVLWSRVEERLGCITVQLLGAEPIAGLRMYEALTSSADRVAVLRAVARDRLDEEMRNKLEGLLVRYAEARWKRNNVIRGHWYVSDEHPDELVWADPADEAVDAGDFWTGFKSRFDFRGQLEFARSYKRRRPDYLLFNKQDLEAILDELRSVGFALTDFCVDLEDRGRPADSSRVVQREDRSGAADSA
jgi:hypothetical protein